MVEDLSFNNNSQMKSIAILQINTCLHIGGTGMVAESCGREVLKEGWDSYIAYSRNYISQVPSSASKIIKIGNKVDVYIHALQTRIFDTHGLGSQTSTKKFIEDIDKISPDIVHLHNLHGYYLNYPLLFSYLKEKSIPVVWTLHDCWSFTGHCTHFESVGCEKWKIGCGKCPRKKDYPSSMLFDKSKSNYLKKINAYGNYDKLTLVPVSNWIEKRLNASFLQNHKIRVIHNGIDLNKFHPASENLTKSLREKYGLKDKRIILGVASTWTPMKGLLDFIELRKVLPETVLIVLLGLTEKQIQKLPRGIVGLKRTEDFDELLGFYSLSNVFCNPTYEDTFPTTNLEALACGTPVITYKTGGSPEAIDRDTGLVVEKGDITGLSKAILHVLSNNKEHYSTACRKRAEAKWNREDRFKEYIELYKEIIKSI